MPISLIASESQHYEPVKKYPNVINKKARNTCEMVNVALTELHNAKGNTLKRIYDFISTSYNLGTLTKNRIGLIKKYLKSLDNNKDIENVTGRGLSGHFKLVNKAQFMQRNKTNPKLKKLQKNPTKPHFISNKTAPVIPRQQTPHYLRNNHASQFDTPIEASHFRTSTPFINVEKIPGAPEGRKRAHKQKLPELETETPRSSLPTKTRKLYKRPTKALM